jgi:hypothetical protein
LKGSTFQQELWIQYDIVQVLGPVYSLELEGLHRRYDFDLLTGHPWSWGYAYLSLKRSAWTATRSGAACAWFGSVSTRPGFDSMR